MYVCEDKYMHTHMFMYTLNNVIRMQGGFALQGSRMFTWLWIKTRVVAGPPPLLQPFVAGPLLQTRVADLCVEYCSLPGACRGRLCRRTPPSVTNLCREMAAQACYKANVFDSLPREHKCPAFVHLAPL